jgi:rod shape-determining protein MreC
VSALLIVAVALITLDFRSGGQSPLHNAGAAVFGPIERGAGYLTRPVAGAFDAVTGDDSGEISALQQQNDELRAQLSQAQNAEAKDPQLSSLLQLAGRGGYRVVAASVVGAGGSYSDTVSIDAGSRDGIALNDTVLNGDGLVGTVTQTGSTMAGANSLRLRLFSANVTLKPGEQLVTFGSVDDTPYVPGVPVGTITSVTSTPGSLTQTAQVSPFADFSSLGVVGVVVAPPRTDPRYSVLPKKAG